LNHGFVVLYGERRLCGWQGWAATMVLVVAQTGEGRTTASENHGTAAPQLHNS